MGVGRTDRRPAPRRSGIPGRRRRPPDAAGGRAGASTGISAVHNLVWKLASVLRGAGGEELLDTYQAERHPAGVQAVQASGVNARAMAGSRGRPGGVPGWRDRWLAVEANGSGNRYRSALTVPDDPTDARGQDPGDVAEVLDGTPGTRLPHRWVSPGVSTLDLVDQRWTLLSRQDRVGGSPVAVRDPGEEFAEAAGIGETGAVLVRPDGYVSWRARSSTDTSDDAFRLVLASLPVELVP